MTDVSSTLSVLPQSPGVYIYKNRQREIIYVGKAINLSKRVKQYFQREDAVGDKTLHLVSEIDSIDTIPTESEFDALLLEAKLIKEHQPKYNVVAKDDKSPLYVAITIGEELPHVYFTRKPKGVVSGQLSVLYFGPFQSARAARNLLRSLRHVIPYCTQKERNGRRCFYTHLHLCNPCPSAISKLNDPTLKRELTKKYRRNIFRLRDILSGKAVSVIKDMEKDMENLATAERFEEAQAIRNHVFALKSILTKRYDPAVYIQSDSMLTEIVEKERTELINILEKYYPTLKKLDRIECFDISNTMGTNATASMVVMTRGNIDKSQYRKFRMRTKQTPNDFAMMQEALTRRFNHPEWPFPNLLVIDGGKGQVSAAKQVLNNLQPTTDPLRRSFSEASNPQLIPIIGLAKREEEIVVPIDSGWKIIRLPFSSGGLKLLQRLRDEAHRFAITYHKLLRGKKSLV